GHEFVTGAVLKFDGLLPYIIMACNKAAPETSQYLAIAPYKKGLQHYRAYIKPNAIIPEYDVIRKFFVDLLEYLRIYSDEDGVINFDHIKRILDRDAKDEVENGKIEPTIGERELQESTLQKIKDPELIAGNIKVVHSFSTQKSDNAMIGQIKSLQRTGVSYAQIPDISEIVPVLRREFPWFERVIELISTELQVRAMSSNEFRIQPILMLGDPGVGKSAFCARLGELAAVPFTIMSLGGSISNQVLAGTDRGWNTAKPSLPLQTIINTGMANPLIVLDELDKAGGSDQNGRISDTLLGMLEPVTSEKWFDPFAMGHVDLSHVNWIATANDISQMPRTLLSRMQVVRVNGPEKSHYPAIVWTSRRHFINEYGLSEFSVPYFTDAEWEWLEQYYTSPRIARKATEHLLRSRISKPLTGVLH
ncbi:MAG: AAA family ATPase, partial [Chromatiales bacterium]|nr:AAA family ATPase [Chromatiales bacterium]